MTLNELKKHKIVVGIISFLIIFLFVLIINSSNSVRAISAGDLCSECGTRSNGTKKNIRC